MISMNKRGRPKKKNKVIFKRIAVRSDVDDKLNFLSKIFNRSKSKLISEYISLLFNIGCTFSDGNLEYDYSVLGEGINITVRGKNRLNFGTALNDADMLKQLSESDEIE